MSDISIRAEGISKQYKLGAIGTGTLRHDFNRLWHSIRGKDDPYLKIGQANDRSKKAESEFVWALRDINFEVRKGEVLGVIGNNGAGKSTLLKILSKITAPTTGNIKVNGRIASLLEVGTGFHPELSGRENIFLNGAILGMRKWEVEKKFDEIVDFSGVEAYIDTPVKRYSSGMYVRLAFAVAAHLEPEILIVDEVLAVGDADFQKKCMGRMKDVSINEGRTVLFVSHNLSAIRTLCNNAILLKNGEVISDGTVDVVLDKYLEGNVLASSHWVCKSKPTSPIGFNEMEIDISGSQPNLKLHLKAKLLQSGRVKPFFFCFNINTSFGTTIFQAIPNEGKYYEHPNDKGEIEVNVCIDLPGLIPGVYSISTWVGSDYTHTYDWIQECLAFEVVLGPNEERAHQYSYNNGFFISPSRVNMIQYRD